MASRKGRRVMRNVSLQPDHDKALRLFATQDGHETPSRAVQDMIEREAMRRFGLDWRDRVRAEGETPGVAA